jgi:hypothetical protein
MRSLPQNSAESDSAGHFRVKLFDFVEIQRVAFA